MTGAVTYGPSMGDELVRALSPALFLRDVASLMWNCSRRSLKKRSRMTAAPNSNATSNPL